MAKIKENLSAVKFFQEKMHKGETSIASSDLSKIDVDTAQPNQQFRNIQLKKDFFGSWSIKIINDHHDLDGKPIEENKKLVTRLKALWENGKREIKFTELKAMNINTSSSQLKIHNFKLSDGSIFIGSTAYDISLVDNNKSIDGVWLDHMINTERILDVLKDFEIKSKILAKISELDLNKLLENHFKKYFENVKKGGTSDKGLIDLIIGDMVYGIELKLARELRKTTQADRALGQIDRYIEKFGSNFMVVIAGNEQEKKEKSVQDLIKKIRNGKGTYYYLEPHD